MIAIVFDSKHALLARHSPTPKTDDRNNVLIQVSTAGICRTDLEILKGYMGFTGILGHEFTGTVIEGPEALKSKRVVSEINISCGKCEYCQAGLSNHCPNRSVLGIDKHDGAFAQYVCVPSEFVHAIGDSVSDDEAVFVEPLAAAFQITRQVDLDSKRVAVLGAGRLGQLVARVIKNCTTNTDMVLVGKHQWKLDLAERQGITTLHQSDFVYDSYFDVVIDATGTASGFTSAVSAIKPRGTIVLKSTFATESGLNMAPVVVKEITIVGSRCGPFDKAIDALACGKIEVTDLIHKRFPLEEGLEALTQAQSPNNIKVLIDVQK